MKKEMTKTALREHCNNLIADLRSKNELIGVLSTKQERLKHKVIKVRELHDRVVNQLLELSCREPKPVPILPCPVPQRPLLEASVFGLNEFRDNKLILFPDEYDDIIKNPDKYRGIIFTHHYTGVQLGPIMPIEYALGIIRSSKKTLKMNQRGTEWYAWR